MGFNPLDVLTLGGKILDRVVPDKAANEAAKLEMFKAIQAGEFHQAELDAASARDQVELDKIDAASGDKFQRRWRPFVGWVCGAGLAYDVIAHPLIAWICAVWAPRVTPPPINVEILVTMLFAMLGLGGMRTMEKLKASRL